MLSGEKSMEFECLKRKLVFGDEEQITAINALCEQDSCEDPDGFFLMNIPATNGLKTFKVELKIKGTCRVTVNAENQMKAKEAALKRIEEEGRDYGIVSTLSQIRSLCPSSVKEIVNA
jgi:hypothetical protein